MDESPYILAKDGLPARKSGRWAQRKHHYLNNYCGITTKAMKRKFRLVYLDVMAGPGRCKLGDGEEFPGSPFVALEHDFSEYVFVESDERLIQALRKRLKRHPKESQVRVIQEDWTQLADAQKLFFDKTHLIVAFVDPTGISQVPMSSILSLIRSPRIDLLLTIQYRRSWPE